MCQPPETCGPKRSRLPRALPWAKDGAGLGDPPPLTPPKIPKPKHRFHRILISTFLGVMNKPQAFTAAGRGLSCSPRFAASDGSEFGVTIGQILRHGVPRQGVTTSASGSLRPTCRLPISVITSARRRRHRGTRGGCH